MSSTWQPKTRVHRLCSRMTPQKCSIYMPERIAARDICVLNVYTCHPAAMRRTTGAVKRHWALCKGDHAWQRQACTPIPAKHIV